MDAELNRSSGMRAGRLHDRRLEDQARALLETAPLLEAQRFAEADDARVLEQQRALTEIPAPPFAEAERGVRMAELLRESGLADVTTDEVGNVLAVHAPGAEGAGRAPLIVSAHLDTVFPADTDVRVREVGDRLVGPGISDDGRGLAALLSLARIVSSVALPFGRPLVFAATVGEEGAGNLRGVRHLFREGGVGHGCAGFVSLDGAGLHRIVTTGVGSRRFRVSLRGPGGHSWVNWGTANPIHTLGAAVARWAKLALPVEPAATLTVARWGGGTSINAIPQEAWVELELRCGSEEILDRTERRVRDALEDALREAARQSAPGMEALRAEVESIGERPAGGTDPAARLVRAAVAATRAVGGMPELAISSTDANIPMALGIPAITMGAGGEAGQAHTPEEWYRNVRGPTGVVRALLTLLLADGG